MSGFRLQLWRPDGSHEWATHPKPRGAKAAFRAAVASGDCVDATLFERIATNWTADGPDEPAWRAVETWPAEGAEACTTVHRIEQAPGDEAGKLHTRVWSSGPSKRPAEVNTIVSTLPEPPLPSAGPISPALTPAADASRRQLSLAWGG